MNKTSWAARARVLVVVEAPRGHGWSLLNIGGRLALQGTDYTLEKGELCARVTDRPIC